jgi:prevent-host-death family protein
MTVLKASDARIKFSETLNRVAYAGERIVLQRSGKGVAALVSMEDLALLQELEDRLDLEAARAALKEPRKSWAEVKAKLGL